MRKFIFWGSLVLIAFKCNSAYALIAVCSPAPCAQEVTQRQVLAALRTTIAKEATLRQVANTLAQDIAKEATLGQVANTLAQELVFQRQQFTPNPGATPTPTVTSTYQMTTAVQLVICVPPGGAALNLPAVSKVQEVCTRLNAALKKFMQIQTNFNTEMNNFAQAFQTLSAPGTTVAGILNNSVQVQVLQGKQANLVGRHMANIEWVKRELGFIETDLAAVRGTFLFGGL